MILMGKAVGILQGLRLAKWPLRQVQRLRGIRYQSATRFEGFEIALVLRSHRGMTQERNGREIVRLAAKDLAGHLACRHLTELDRQACRAGAPARSGEISRCHYRSGGQPTSAIRRELARNRP